MNTETESTMTNGDRSDSPTKVKPFENRAADQSQPKHNWETIKKGSDETQPKFDKQSKPTDKFEKEKGNKDYKDYSDKAEGL